MAFQITKHLEHGVSNPMVARLNLQTLQLLEKSNQAKESREAIGMIYLNSLIKALMRCSEIEQRIVADKPDIGLSIARQWFDVDKVDAIADVPTSSVALAVNEIIRDKNKVFLAVGPATSDLTGKACSPNTVHWIYDTWALANGTGNAIVKRGGDTWFFITADYAFGYDPERRQRCSARSITRFPARTSPRSCCRRRQLGANERKFTGQGLLQNFILPNFYFHCTTAYDILRHCGVELSKRDFMSTPVNLCVR